MIIDTLNAHKLLRFLKEHILVRQFYFLTIWFSLWGSFV